ncbi:TetR/AcrR family transcriptional regulator [Chamaesiphon sp. GL140_3_metabinner_50]|uniref:TetR/AcrR family transcriptional regulator n=1 Tax=Chamaesiphon sp. GL140_3_metabinner_50 TaxID=2970812 RepID=UPI0025E4368C|nr:TetR/AcrR family transcriptional regulator [Chamaesiphon sp. GL140_3_metabinner_50]
MKVASSSKNSSENSGSRHLKGQDSRTTILLTAAKMATTKGLAGLSIGDLAAEVGMSKSGLYAHFKSKEELELATIEMAAIIFNREVLQPALTAPAGTERLNALVNSFLSHLERRVFPGGCFFSAVAAELDTRPGPARDRVVEIIGTWLALLRQCILEGQDLGELDPLADVDLAVFEIEAMLLGANFLFMMKNDPIHLIQGRAGVENVLRRLTVSPKSKQKRSRMGTVKA